MAASGVLASRTAFGGPNVTPIAPTESPVAQYGAPSTYSAAVNTQGADYDRIMKQYQDTISNIQNRPTNAQQISPQVTPYKTSQNVTNAMSNLSGLAATGGYSDEDKANIRARGISPIRSIYANAKMNMDRNRALSGGYSPNYNAAASKMAREQSETIAGKTTDIEAGIAERVAQNKLGIAPSYASFAGSESAAQNAANQRNADIVNETNRFNSNLAYQSNASRDNMILQAIQGMQGLYGTNPALISLFGNQVAGAAGLAQGQQAQNTQQRRAILG